MKAGDISRQLAARVDGLVRDLLPGGHREGHEWRCGSVAGEPGNSLGVHLTGSKAGVWSDFSAGQKLVTIYCTRCHEVSGKLPALTPNPTGADLIRVSQRCDWDWLLPAIINEGVTEAQARTARAYLWSVSSGKTPSR